MLELCFFEAFLMNNFIIKRLRQGITNIISSFSAPSCQEEANKFDASTHLQREIFFVIDGDSRYMLNGSVYPVPPGTVCLINHWESHAFGYRKNDYNLLHFWINIWSNEHMSAYAMHVEKNGVYRISTRRLTFPPEFQMLITRRWDRLMALKEVTQEIVMDYMKLPLEMLFNEIAFQLQNESSSEKENSDSILESLKKYIQTTNGRGCSYQKLEQVSGYSRSHLAHRFRKYAGCSLGNYIDKVRVAYTVKALQRGLKQKEIAFELGFSSPSNFWLWMKKHREDIKREEICPDQSL